MIKLRSLTIITAHLGFHSECKVDGGAKPIIPINDCNLSFSIKTLQFQFRFELQTPRRIREKFFYFFFVFQLLAVALKCLSFHLLKAEFIGRSLYHKNTKLLFCLQPSRDKFTAKINKKHSSTSFSGEKFFISCTRKHYCLINALPRHFRGIRAVERSGTLKTLSRNSLWDLI